MTISSGTFIFFQSLGQDSPIFRDTHKQMHRFGFRNDFAGGSGQRGTVSKEGCGYRVVIFPGNMLIAYLPDGGKYWEIPGNMGNTRKY